ncbi:MAG: sulfatase-like hydrolase/transferase, partial [Bacteroidales bacterium]|nr:sulfatase-like hydrolase/transferase [Bacteroidales bacterium]
TVHTPIQGCKAYDDTYQDMSFALPDSGRMQIREEHNGITRINQSHPKYAAMVRSMDTNVGRLMDKLEAIGKLDNTIVVFTSDNGGLSTTGNGGPTSVLPLRAGKGWCYEGGIRVPLMIRYPGIRNAGSVCEQPVISTDFYPTLAELAGIPLPEQVNFDGQSVVRSLLEPELSYNRTLTWHYPHYHGSTWRPGSALRSDSWKLVEFYEDKTLELYDLSNDPEELNDLSKELPLVADTLRQRLHRILDEMGASYPVPRYGHNE